MNSRRFFSDAWRTAWSQCLLVGCSTVFLAACGGGGSSSGDDSSASAAANNTPTYLTFKDSANGTVVLAANDFQVQFNTDGQLVYHGTAFTGTVLDIATNNVAVNGAAFAFVALVQGSNGAKVAALLCKDTVSQRVTINETSNVLSCSAAGTGTGTGTGTDTGTTGSGTGTSTGTGTSGTGTNPAPAAIACAAGHGAGSQGLQFFDPSGYTSYHLSTTAASSTDSAILSWGVKYSDPSLSATSYIGSVLARLWAVDRSYTGGSISGAVLGTFNPSFSGSGARSPNRVFNGGYSTTQVQSTASQTNPATGSYCIVATLEQYDNGSWALYNWVQFDQSVGFN